MAEKSKNQQANAQFAKTQRANDAKKATAAYESAAVALRAKTERLKALRLARDATNPPPQAVAPKRRSGGKKGANTGSLADWLDGQAKEGRRS